MNVVEIKIGCLLKTKPNGNASGVIMKKMNKKEKAIRKFKGQKFNEPKADEQFRLEIDEEEK